MQYKHKAKSSSYFKCRYGLSLQIALEKFSVKIHLVSNHLPLFKDALIFFLPEKIACHGKGCQGWVNAIFLLPMEAKFTTQPWRAVTGFGV